MFRILHSSGFTEEEINEKKAIIYGNTVVSMCTILQAMDSVLYIPLQNPDNEKLKQAVYRVQELGEEQQPLTEDVAKAIETLWEDPAVKKAYEMRSEFQLTDSAKQ